MTDAKQSRGHAPESDRRIKLLFPPSDAVVSTSDGATVADGIAVGAQAGWYAQIDVFTDRWYAPEGHIPIAPDGAFHQTIYLGGQGAQQCYHLLRVRLFDQAGRVRASDLSFGVARASPDGSPPIVAEDEAGNTAKRRPVLRRCN